MFFGRKRNENLYTTFQFDKFLLLVEPWKIISTFSFFIILNNPKFNLILEVLFLQKCTVLFSTQYLHFLLLMCNIIRFY